MEHDPELCADVIVGGIDKYVKQQGRNTVMQNVEHDEALVGYARIAGPDACPFCKTMSSQCFHFKSRKTAMSGSHGDVSGQFHAYCNCGLAVAFKDARGRIRAEGLDGTDVENWDPDELYREYQESGWSFGHDRRRENSRRRGYRGGGGGGGKPPKPPSNGSSGIYGPDGRDEELRKIREQHPEAYAEWQEAVARAHTLETSSDIEKHIKGTDLFNAAESPSYFYVDESMGIDDQIAEVRSLIDEHAGKGLPIITRKGKWSGKEKVSCGKIIGVDGWSNTETSSMKIHYGKKVVHAAPRYDGSGRSLG